MCHHLPFRFVIILGQILMGSLLLNAQEPAEQAPSEFPPILIRPANYDPLDEWAYARARGEVMPGHAAGGTVWNAGSGVRVADHLQGEPGAEEAEGPRFSDATPIPAPMLFGSSFGSYAAAYAAVPFSRAEYEANPGYRHAAALELLTGTLRPTTIVNHRLPYASRYPDFLHGPQTSGLTGRYPMGYAPQLGRHGFWYRGIWYPGF